MQFAGAPAANVIHMSPSGACHEQKHSPWFSATNLVVGGSILVALIAVAWAVADISTKSTQYNGISGHITPFQGVTLYTQQQIGDIQQYNAAQQAMQEQLQQNFTYSYVQQMLQGSKLPKGVSWQLAQQLLIDKALLQYSLQAGHAAARVKALRTHYQYSFGSMDRHDIESSSSDSSSSDSDSRGILIVGGSRTHLANAYILLRMLRDHLQCELPIEVVYYGQQELDLAAAALVQDYAAQQKAAGRPSISLVDGLAVHQQYIETLSPHPNTMLTSWVAKIHALCWVVSFRHVLLLDSDNIPVQDPAVLFNTSAYLQHGFIIWPDFWHNLWMEAAVYKLLNLAVPWEVNPQGLAAESGQVLIDRAAHADVLEWLWMLNAHHELVYKCVVGDKDTFKMAFELAGKTQHYIQVSQPPMELLGDAGGKRNRYFHLCMGQSSPDGAALMFMHRTARGKFFPWCAAKRRLHGSCQPAYITLPVMQEQLEASVRDAGSMTFDAAKVDTAWHHQHCVTAGGPAGDQRTCSGSNSAKQGCKHGAMHQQGRRDGSSKWLMPLPVCNYTPGQLPIPALPASAVSGLREYLAALDDVYMGLQSVLAVQLLDRVKVMLGKL